MKNCFFNASCILVAEYSENDRTIVEKCINMAMVYSLRGKSNSKIYSFSEKGVVELKTC